MAKCNYSTVVRFRCSETEKNQIEKFVSEGQFKSISEFFRLLLNYYEDHSLDLLDYQNYRELYQKKLRREEYYSDNVEA